MSIRNKHLRELLCLLPTLLSHWLLYHCCLLKVDIVIVKKCFTVCYLLYVAYLIYWSDIKNYSYTNKNGVKQRTEVFALQMWKACLSDIKYSSNKDDQPLFNYFHQNRFVKNSSTESNCFTNSKENYRQKSLQHMLEQCLTEAGEFIAIVVQVLKFITRHNRTNHSN